MPNNLNVAFCVMQKGQHTCWAFLLVAFFFFLTSNGKLEIVNVIRQKKSAAIWNATDSKNNENPQIFIFTIFSFDV